MPKHAKYLLKLKIEGPRAGTISVPDLVRICQSAQDAVNRKAEAMRGGQSLRPGPKSSIVYQECTLELVGIERGSTVLPFCLAKPQESFPETMTFGKDVIREVATAVKQLGSRKVSKKAYSFEPGLLDSLRQMGEVFEKGTVKKIEWIVPGNGSRPIKAVFDKRVREKVIARIRIPSTRQETVEGVLEMADFKEQDHRCRIHPPIGQPIVCTFLPEQEDEILAAMRKPVRISGTATVNPNTDKTESIAVEKISVVEQLLVGAKDFYTGRSLEQLAKMQGVSPLDNHKVLVGGWPEGEDVDEFLEDIYSSRIS